jgi:hypothetical protein
MKLWRMMISVELCLGLLALDSSDPSRIIGVKYAALFI